MANRYAKIESGTVANVIRATADHVASLPGTWVETDEASPGWTYDGATFSRPDTRETKGTFREFMSLFTQDEKRAIKIASLDPANVDLALWYDEAQGAAYIDLTDADLAAGMAVLVGAGLLTQARSDEILASDFDAV